MSSENLINKLLTELNNNKSSNNDKKNNNLNLIYKLRKCIKQLLDFNLHENDLILNEIEIILNRLEPIDLTIKSNQFEKEIDDDDGDTSLFFEYSFFKLLKFILSFAFNGTDVIDHYANKNESNLIELMKYCLSKSIKQYELMLQNKKFYLIKEKFDCDDRNDQLNLIEL
jgi:hypothetical protein